MNINLRAPSLASSCTLSIEKEEQEYAGAWKVILMRKITWLVLVAYTLLLFKPAMPVFMDVLAHTFWEQQHLLVVHEVHGKFHVHNELVKNSHQSDKDRQSANSKYDADEYLPVSVNHNYKLSVKTIESLSYPSYSCYYSSTCMDIDNPPPNA